eukprot:s599_g2.t2
MDTTPVPRGSESRPLHVPFGIGCSLALQNWRSEESAAAYLHPENGLPKATDIDADLSVIDGAAAQDSESSSRSSRQPSPLPLPAQLGADVSKEEEAEGGSQPSGLSRLVKLARRAVRDEVSEWVPDEEEKAIIARAVKRLQARLAAKEPERAKLSRVQVELSRREAAKAPRASLMENRNRAEYQLSQPEGSQPSSPISGRRKGILRTTSFTTPPQITVSEAVDLPITSTTAVSAFAGYTFPREPEGGPSPVTTPRDSTSPQATPRAQMLPRLPLKPRSSAVSIAETEELLEFPESSPATMALTKTSMSQVSESTATGVSISRRSSTAASASAKTHRSPRQSLANIFRFKDSQIPMNLSRRSDLELGWALKHALEEAANSGQLKDFAAQRRRSTPTTEAPSSPGATAATNSPCCIKLDPDPSLPPSPPPSDERRTDNPRSLADKASIEELIQQRLEAYRDEALQTLRAEQDKELARVQESLGEALESIVDGRLMSLQAETGRRNIDQAAQGALGDEVRSLQGQLERMEETQSDLLLQLQKAETRLENSVKLHEDALGERCQELQSQLQASATQLRDSAPKISPQRSEESAEKLQSRLDSLEETLQDKSERKSVSSVEDIVFDSSELKEEVGQIVAELEARIVVDLQALREEITEQTQVLRSHCDQQVARMEETAGGQFEALEDLRKQLHGRRGTAAEKELIEELEASKQRLKDEVSSETLAALEARYDQRMHNFEDSIETRRGAQQREFDRMFTDLHRSMSKLEGSQKALVTKTFPEVKCDLAAALGKERAEQQDDRLHEVARLCNKKVENALSLGESSMQKLTLDLSRSKAADKAAIADLEKQLRDFASSECDAVLQALKGRINQEEEERVISMTSIRQDINDLKAALGPLPVVDLDATMTSPGPNTGKSPVASSLASLTPVLKDPGKGSPIPIILGTKDITCTCGAVTLQRHRHGHRGTGLRSGQPEEKRVMPAEGPRYGNTSSTNTAMRLVFPRSSSRTLGAGTTASEKSAKVSSPRQKEGELPYGLGKLSHQAYKVVDVGFSPEWSQVLSRLGQAPTPQQQDQEEEWKLQAVAFARLVSKMSVELDSTGQAPAEVPMAELPPQKPAFGGAGKGLAPGQRVPSHRYLYFMPPGQPGEKRLAMYPAMWLRQLTTSRWVPGTEGGTGAAPKRGWFKPCEVLLKSDPSKPGLPVADLPPDVVRGLGEAFKTHFAWGTVAPEAPVERLEAVGAAARNQAGSEAPEPLWRAVCNAHRLGTLKPVQRQKLKQLASLPVFPAPPDLLDGADRLALSRLVRPATGASQDQAEEIKALVDAKWLVDVRSPDWPLRDVVDDVAALVDFSPTPNKACMEGLVSWCCSAEPGSLSEELRTAFSHALPRGTLARETEVVAPTRVAAPRRSKSLTPWETFKFYLRTSAILRACRSFLPGTRSKRRAGQTGQVTTPEMLELQANPPQKIAILCTDECNSGHLKEIEMLSRAHAVNGDHIFTTGSVEANAAVIKGALRGGHPEHLTVVLPQTEAQQENKLRKLIPACIEAGAHVVPSPAHSSLRFEDRIQEAVHLCHKTVLGKVDQLVAFLPGSEPADSSLVDEARAKGVPSAAFYLQQGVVQS